MPLPGGLHLGWRHIGFECSISLAPIPTGPVLYGIWLSWSPRFLSLRLLMLAHCSRQIILRFGGCWVRPWSLKLSPDCLQWAPCLLLNPGCPAPGPTSGFSLLSPRSESRVPSWNPTPTMYRRETEAQGGLRGRTTRQRERIDPT